MRDEEIEVEVERVNVRSDPSLPVDAAPPVMPGDEIEDDIVPGRVIERERIGRAPDGSLERRLDRIEQEPVRRRRKVTNLAPVLLIILLLALGAIAAAWYFTQTDEKPVTDVVGLQADEAVTQLQDDGFKTDISREESTEPENVVISQTPSAGTEAEEGSTVAIVASSGPELTSVPNAVGLPEAEARDRMAAAGFEVNAVEVFSDEPDGTVVAQNPAAGSELESASSVRLNISKGPGSVQCRVS